MALPRLCELVWPRVRLSETGPGSEAGGGSGQTFASVAGTLAGPGLLRLQCPRAQRDRKAPHFQRARRSRSGTRRRRHRGPTRRKADEFPGHRGGGSLRDGVIEDLPRLRGP